MIRYGNEMLQLLADSDMANDEDRLVLDAVWEGTKTHLEPNDIEQLINDVAERELTEEQRSSVEGYVDDSQSSGDNKLTKEDRND